MTAETSNARELVAKLAAHVRPTCSELWAEAQAFLAAEGVQAGEVSAYDLAVLDDAAETLDRIGEGSAGLREARARIASALSQQPEAQGGGEVAAWETEDGRVISARQKATALRDGGASASSVAPYTTPLYRTAPPSAPVGVELAALRVQEWLHAEHDLLVPVQEIEAAMRTPCSCPATEHALAPPPADAQAVAECHCATCTCAPGMTPAVRFDTSPAAKEGAVRDHLIALGWTPPGAQQTAAEAQGGEDVVQRLRGVLQHAKMGNSYLISQDLIHKAIGAITVPPSATVWVEGRYHPCTHILIDGLKRLEGGTAVLAEWDRARAQADAALAGQQGGAK